MGRIEASCREATAPVTAHRCAFILREQWTWWRNPHQGCDISPKTQDLGHERCDWLLWVLLMFTTAHFSIRPLLYHTAPYTSPSFVFEQWICWKKKTPPDVWCLIFWFIFWLGGAQSEKRALYFTKNLDYVITGLLTFTLTKPSLDGWNTKNLFLGATWRTQSEFWACCMGARALSLRQAFFFFSSGWKTSRRTWVIFFSHWEVPAALLVGKFLVSVDCAACCLDIHAPTSTDWCI